MKAVIQHVAAALFLTPRGTWTANPSEALAFLDEVRARDYVFLHGVDHGVSTLLHDDVSARAYGNGQPISRPVEMNGVR